jgi:hypothetical protein
VVAGERVDQRPVLAVVDAEPTDEHERVTGPGEFVVDAHPVAVSARHALKMPTIEHPLFDRVWAPQMMVDLTSLLALFGWQLRGGWRGQADIDWHSGRSQTASPRGSAG